MPSSFSERLRRTLEQCAIPSLIRYVVLFNALVFLLHLLAPGFTSVLTLDPSLVLQGQIWRLVTWIFVPETLSPFWIFFALLFLLYIGDGLESAIGASRLTLFYLSGVLLCTIASLLFGLAGSGVSLTRGNTFLNLSLLLAYATVFPDFKVLVFFVIPMRISWLALISAFLMIFSALGQPLVVAATLGASFLNFFLFFHHELRTHLLSLKLTREIVKNVRAAQVEPPPLLKKTAHEEEETLHRCEQCGRTERSHPDLDFRVTASGTELCREHLKK
jgi:membrane associated rhomboid family serine protease